jgi:Cd2+/Zn2+-exporting ATPase
MAREAALGAVSLKPASGEVSIAMIGRKTDPGLEARVASAVAAGREGSAQHRCELLTGRGDCRTCDIPLAPDERQFFTVSRDNGSATVTRLTCPTSPHFWHWRDVPLPKYVPRELPLPDHEHGLDEWKQQLVAALICGAAGLAGWLVERQAGAGAASLALYVLAFLAGAWFQVEEVWERLQHRVLDVHFLMLAVAAGSASIGAWAEGAVLLFLFSLSGALEHYAMGRTQREIQSLFKTAPKTAIRLDDEGHEHETPVEQLRAGMRLLIKPGDQFPVDADVLKGETASDESNLTGEATPVEKRRGDTVLAGTINLWGAVEVMTLRPASESSLQKIIRLIHEAQRLKAPSQRFTDKFGTRYTYLILGLSFVMFFVWWLGFKLPPFASHGDQSSAFYRTMTLLVVSSPCALVLSIPSAVLAAIAWGARRGILFRGGAAVEELGEVQIVALDKTGTLTTGELQVERVESFPPGRENEVASLAYSLEKLSTHPLARAITRHGKQNQLPVVELAGVESVTGLGLRATRGGVGVFLGRREWLAESGVEVAEAFRLGDTETAFVRRWTAQVPPTEAGFSEVWLAHGDLVGRVLLRDDLRPQAAGVVDELRRAGLRSVVLTGDRRATGELLKARLNVDEVRAELKPDEKVAAIVGFSQAGQLVAMVGDGVNDAPSLAAAHVGVAMGARGSDAALEQAEVVLMHDRLENFLAAFRLSQRARRVIWQNLVISLGTALVLVGFALAGKIPLPVGVIGHEGSTVVVVLNSLRLLLGRGR